MPPPAAALGRVLLPIGETARAPLAVVSVEGCVEMRGGSLEGEDTTG
jgi:hypothetical protein